MKKSLLDLYNSTLEEADSYRLVKSHLSDGRDFSDPVDVVAVGKAAAGMAAAALDGLGSPFQDGFLLTKYDHISPNLRRKLEGKFQLFEAAHPVPGRAGQAATDALKKWLNRPQSTGRSLLVLVSGGASSLLVSPSAPLTLDDLKKVNSALLASGLPIEQMNVLRKHLSSVKGGRMAQLAKKSYRRQKQLVMVDICAPQLPESEILSLVGSGPWVGDPSNCGDAEKILKQLKNHLHPEVAQRVAQALSETPSDSPCESTLVGSHRTLLRLARAQLGERHLEPEDWNPEITGEVSRLAHHFSSTALRLQQQGLSGVLVASGEPTVVLNDRPGRGGRCQELALHMARCLKDSQGITFLAGSSDGTDGPTDDAGALVNGSTWNKLCQIHGLERVERALAQHDSGTLLASLPGALITTGPTGQNLNDLFLLEVENIELSTP